MERRKIIKIGIFAVIVIILFIWGYSFLKGKNLFSNDAFYYGAYNNVNGLTVSNSIYMSGMKIGTVREIYFSNDSTSTIIVVFSIKRDIRIPVESAATLMSNILNQRKFYPYYVQLILGGYDDTGGHVYSLDAAGGAIPDKYTAGGSGSPYVYGVLEDIYKDDLTTNEGIDIAVRAITAAKSRDSASGGEINVAIVTKDGFNEIPEEEIKKRVEKLAK